MIAQYGSAVEHPAVNPRFRFLTVTLLLGLVLLCGARTVSAESFVGRVASIESASGPQVVHVLRPGKTGFAKVKTGEKLFEGDTVKTGPGVKAQIELTDTSTVNLGPSATLRVKGYLVNAGEGRRNYVLKALKGTFRFIISKAFKAAGGAASAWQDSNVTVETPTAVAGIKGTDFFVIIETGDEGPKVTIAVNEGQVSTRSSSLRVAGSTTVGANQMTVVIRGMAPGQATEFAQQLRDSLMKATTPSGQQQTTGGTPGGQQAASSQSEIANQVAAGMPLSEIMNNATEAGMPIDQIVAAAIDAGAAPYDVVFTAVAEGYAAQAVVTAALNEGAPLADVVAGALMAGAENRAITTGATNAGASPSQIAQVIVVYDTNTAPVYTYSTTGATQTVDSIVGSTVTVVVSGGGGAPPSPLPGSPL